MRGRGRDPIPSADVTRANPGRAAKGKDLTSRTATSVSKVNQYQRAHRAWPLLVTTASSGTTITYGALADRLGIHPRTIRFVLGKIQDYCLDAKLPPLTILVVNKSRHHPGAGFVAWDVDDWEAGAQCVRDYPWKDRHNPFNFAKDGVTPEDLAQRLVSDPRESTQVYREIQDRGYAQVVFRLALMQAYEGKCAFCRLSLGEALQAAHIIPWSRASARERLLPSNGLLLCATHHALFDAEVMSVDLNGKIICNQERLSRPPSTPTDEVVWTSLRGCTVLLPKDGRHRPSATSLRRRAEGSG